MVRQICKIGKYQTAFLQYLINNGKWCEHNEDFIFNKDGGRMAFLNRLEERGFIGKSGHEFLPGKGTAQRYLITQKGRAKLDD